MVADFVEEDRHGVVVGDGLFALVLDAVGLLARFGHLVGQSLNRRRVVLYLLDKGDVGRRLQFGNLLELVDLVQQQRFVLRRDRNDVVHRQVAQHTALDLNLLGVGLPLHLGAGFEFDPGVNPHLAEHPQRLLVEVAVENQRRGSLAVEPALRGFGLPFVRIAVAVEADGAALLDHLLQDFVDGLFFLGPGFDFGVDGLLEVREFVGHGRVERNHRLGAVVRRTHGAELEAVAREGERRGAVAVGVVQEQRRDMRNAAHLEDVLGVEADGVVALGRGQFV